MLEICIHSQIKEPYHTRFKLYIGPGGVCIIDYYSGIIIVYYIDVGHDCIGIVFLHDRFVFLIWK
jgi:hypothetical protein